MAKQNVLRVHEMRVQPEYYRSLKENEKKVEMRPHDRDFRVGDYLLLRPYEPRKPDASFATEGLVCKITHLIDANDTFGRKALRAGWCALSLETLYACDTVDTILRGTIVKYIAPPAAKAKKRRR